MKKYLLLLIAIAIISNKTNAQSLGNISLLYCPTCGYVGLIDSIVASVVPGATAYIWFSPQINNPTLTINGSLLPAATPMNNPQILFQATQAACTVCVYAINVCCTTDTACCIIPGTAPQPIMSPTNSSTALPNSSGIYSVLPPPPNSCTDGGAYWSIIPTSAGTITGSGNDTVTVNFSPTFTSCLLCAHFQTTFNLDGPDTCMVINTPVGINESPNQTSGIQLYPNPAGEELHVQSLKFSERSPSDKVGDEIKIYDMMGKEVLQSAINLQSTIINIKSLQSGIYFIEINGMRKKFVKQ